MEPDEIIPIPNNPSKHSNILLGYLMYMFPKLIILCVPWD